MDNNAKIFNNPKIDQKYYAVCCKCGHVKTYQYVPITFAIKANDGKEAAEKARNLARVKHHKKYAILSCKKISKEKYDSLNDINRNDPYLKCKNIQEQRLIQGFESRIMDEPMPVNYKRTKKERKDLIKYKLKKETLFLKELNETMSIIYQ